MPVIKGHLTAFCTCAAISFLIQPHSFQSWYLGEESLSIDLVRCVKIVILILKNCLVIHERLKCQVCVLNSILSRNTMSSRGVFKASRDESYFQPISILFWKKKGKKKMGGWTSENSYSCRCTCKLEEGIAYVLVYSGHSPHKT